MSSENYDNYSIMGFAEAVTDEPSFLNFLDLLAQDFQKEREIEKTNHSSPYGPGALGWENGSIDAFLDAAARCGLDHIRKSGIPSPPHNIWQRCAQILLRGKYYE